MISERVHTELRKALRDVRVQLASRYFADDHMRLKAIAEHTADQVLDTVDAELVRDVPRYRLVQLALVEFDALNN